MQRFVYYFIRFCEIFIANNAELLNLLLVPKVSRPFLQSLLLLDGAAEFHFTKNKKRAKNEKGKRTEVC